MRYIAYTGGGTGGHIYPGLAVCEQMRSMLSNRGVDDIQFIWIGNIKGMDKTIIEKSGSIDVFKGIPCGKLRRYFSLSNFFDILNIASGFFASLMLMLRCKPLFLFSKGGFVSVPPCYAAKLLKIPVFTHECDFSPGLATRLNSRCAKKVFISYEQTKSCFPAGMQSKLVVTGNPVRDIFYDADPELGLQFLFGSSNPPNLPILFVLGGSSGALQINNLVRDSYEWLCEHFFVVHQTGKNRGDNEKIVHKNYRSFEFIFGEMSHVLASCDIVLARAGANTLWEAAVQGKPMVLVPLSGSGTRGDQVENAQLFKDNGAAEVLIGGSVTAEGVKLALLAMLDRETRSSYSLHARKMTPDVKPAVLIAQLLCNELEESVCL